jgi:hypothetical protein
MHDTEITKHEERLSWMIQIEAEVVRSNALAPCTHNHLTSEPCSLGFFDKPCTEHMPD